MPNLNRMYRLFQGKSSKFLPVTDKKDAQSYLACNKNIIQSF